jgi:hypothetical protein
MILTRITRAIREQNWFAVALEFVIVIAGIVIGFQVTLVGQQNAEHAREAKYLTQLELELSAVTGELDVAQAETDAYYRRISSFLNGLRNGDAETAQEGAWGLIGITAVVSVNLQPAALHELISSGELRIISNQQVRSALASIPQIQANSESRLSQIARSLAPVADEVAMRVDIHLPDVEDFSTASWTNETVQFDFNALSQDETFLRQLNHAAFNNRVLKDHLRRRQLELTDIRDQVSADIETRGLR